MQRSMQGLQQSAGLKSPHSVSSGANLLFCTRPGNAQRRRQLHSPVTSAGKDKGQAHFQSYVQAIPPQQNFLAASPWYIKAPVALVAISLVARLLKRLTRGDRGSLDSLEGRGLINEERNVSNSDPFYNNVMKNVRTVAMEELSKDQIEAARIRRSRDREIASLNLESVELPENHPFAVKKRVTKDEEKLQEERLKVTRGLPLQDLAGNRGFPDEGRAAPQQPGAPRAQAPQRSGRAHGGGDA